MKRIVELLEASKDDLPDIYCDLDMVLVNFMKGADAAVGGDGFVANKDKEGKWNKINQVKGFWANLEWMPGAKRLHDFIIRYDAKVLSAYSSRDVNSKKGKLKWLAKHTKFKKPNINLVLRQHKQQYATKNGKPNVLIDDYIKNINEWESKGGIGVHHTSVPKTIGELKKLGYK
jgi:5'(3')-deoxyribonucleotidase